MWDEKFLAQLPQNPLNAAFRMCESFIAFHNGLADGEAVKRHGEYISALAAFEVFAEAARIEQTPPVIGENTQVNIMNIGNFFITMRRVLAKQLVSREYNEAKDHYRAILGVAFSYDFSDGDLGRIQTLLNELRDMVVRSELFDAKHKDRVLKKLENLQRELHKKMSSLDQFWGLVGEAGVALGKFGKDAKPFVDRVKEIAEIIWRTQARAEELPSGATHPMLPAGETRQE